MYITKNRIKQKYMYWQDKVCTTYWTNICNIWKNWIYIAITILFLVTSYALSKRVQNKSQHDR